MEIIISNNDVISEIGNISYLVSRETDRAPASRALIADVVDDGNRQLVERAVSHAFSRVAALVAARLGAGGMVDGDATADDKRFVIGFGDGAKVPRPVALARFEHDLFAYMVECGLCCWFAIVLPERLRYHDDRSAALYNSLADIVSGAVGTAARITPRPF